MLQHLVCNLHYLVGTRFLPFLRASLLMVFDWAVGSATVAANKAHSAREIVPAIFILV